MPRTIASPGTASSIARSRRCTRRARARHVLTATARRIRSYAGDDIELNRIADELLRDVETYAERTMGSLERKAAFYAAEATLKFRDSEGKARRSPR
ncbi:MAG: hypothetical protein ACT4PJ_14255 [Gemmatimonadaceae bacterium]